MEARGEGDGGRPVALRPALREQDELWATLLGQAEAVAAALEAAVAALCGGHAALAPAVRAGEAEVDRREVEIERDCLRILALYEPVARDHRRLAPTLRVNRELERLGDLAEHIARRAAKLARRADPARLPAGLDELAAAAVDQVRRALDALARVDAAAARAVLDSDPRVDGLRSAVTRDLKESLRREPARVNEWLWLLDAAQHLERAADHATNVAEAVIFLAEGTPVRRADPTSPS
jgi:phosphate transport system protein